MQGTPSSIGDIGQTGGIPATPSRSGIDPRIKGTAPASVETEVGENEGHNDAFVAAALVQGGFGRQEAIKTGTVLARKLKRARTWVGLTTVQIASIEGVDEFEADEILHIVVPTLCATGHITPEQRDRAIGADPGEARSMKVMKATDTPGMPAGSAAMQARGADEGCMETVCRSTDYMAKGGRPGAGRAGGGNLRRLGVDRPRVVQASGCGGSQKLIQYPREQVWHAPATPSCGGCCCVQWRGRH